MLMLRIMVNIGRVLRAERRLSPAADVPFAQRLLARSAAVDRPVRVLGVPQSGKGFLENPLEQAVRVFALASAVVLQLRLCTDRGHASAARSERSFSCQC